MDRAIRTAVEGVDPGEPGQAVSTERFHPQSLRFVLFSSALFPFCSSLRPVLSAYPQKTAFISQEVAKKNNLEKNIKRHPRVQQADERAKEPEEEWMSEWCVCMTGRGSEHNRLETTTANRC